MTTIQALQNLYVTLGGEASDVANINTIPAMIEAINTIAASAGIELPAVSETDNGDVLTVVDGAWTKAAPTTPDISIFASGTIDPSGTATVTFKNTSTPSMYLLVVAAYGASQAGAYLLINNNQSALVVTISAATDITVSGNNGMPAKATITNGLTGNPVAYSAIKLN